MLWRAMSESHGDTIEAPSETRAAVAAELSSVSSVSSSPSVADVSASASPPAESRPEPQLHEIRAALQRHDGRVAEAARTLGLSSRYALYRLMKKHGIESDSSSGG